MSGTFAGETVLITGGSSGIGLASAQVIIVGRNPQKLSAALETLGAQARSVCTDLATEAGAVALAQYLTAHDLMLDVLFANAGASNAPELFETTEQDFEAVLNANLKSVFFTVLRCFPRLKRGARVILTSSVAYKRGHLGDPLYAASKAGVRALGRGFAGQPEFLEQNIRVNTISYGAVSTPMTLADVPEMQEALQAWAEERVPLRRWATVQEAALPVLFLASRAANYMTGAELDIDGGLAQI